MLPTVVRAMEPTRFPGNTWCRLVHTTVVLSQSESVANSGGFAIHSDLLRMRAMICCYNAPRISAEMGTVSPFRWLYGMTPSC